jgi:hypothetical protein
MIRRLFVGMFGLIVALGACTIVSGTSDLTGGICHHCADASAPHDTRADAGPSGSKSLTCGASPCDTRSSWCCVGTGGTSGTACGSTCPSGAAFASCFAATDCAAGQACCLYRSNIQGETTTHWFADCQSACAPATDRTVCDSRTAQPCPNGNSCVASEVPGILVCQ